MRTSSGLLKPARSALRLSPFCHEHEFRRPIPAVWTSRRLRAREEIAAVLLGFFEDPVESLIFDGLIDIKRYSPWQSDASSLARQKIAARNGPARRIAPSRCSPHCQPAARRPSSKALRLASRIFSPRGSKRTRMYSRRLSAGRSGMSGPRPSMTVFWARLDPGLLGQRLGIDDDAARDSADAGQDAFLVRVIGNVDERRAARSRSCLRGRR